MVLIHHDCAPLDDLLMGGSMTQEEVDLIYDYLHENYEYVDGELIRITPSSNKKISVGHVLGSFYYQNYGAARPLMRATINFNGENITLPVSHLIWIYHYKQKPKMIKYIDSNYVNNKIENLTTYCGRERENNKNLDSIGTAFISRSGKTRYRYALDIGNGQKISFGSWETKEECQQLHKFVKNIWVNNKTITPQELKIQVMAAFPKSAMRLNKQNKYGFPGIYKRRDRFVARYQGMTSTHDTPAEAYQDVIRMQNGDFETTNRKKTSDSCIKPGCPNPCYCKSLCSKHYHAQIRASNKRIRPNQTGFTGVKLDKGRYAARYASKHLGSFNTPEEAHAAYLKAKEELL